MITVGDFFAPNPVEDGAVMLSVHAVRELISIFVVSCSRWTTPNQHQFAGVKFQKNKK